MKTLYTLLIATILSGCTPTGANQYNALHRAFVQGCIASSIVSSLNPAEGNTLELKATCKKAQ